MDTEICTEQKVPAGFITSITFNILTEADAEKAAVKVIGTVNEVTDPSLGVPNPTSQCLTCGANDSRTCEGHFGLIRFPYTTLHPYFISDVANILNKICPWCKSVKAKKAKSASRPKACKYCEGSLKDEYPPLKFKVSEKDIFGKTAIIAEPKVSRSSSAKRDFTVDYWGFVPDDPQQDEIHSTSHRRVLSHAQVYHILKDVDSRFLEKFFSRKSSIFLQSFPVTPNCHRVAEFGQNIKFDERTRAYRRLVDFRGSANELSERALDCLKLSRLCTEKPSTSKSPYFIDSAPKMSGLKYLKELVLGKRTDHAFRMVCVGDPFIKLDEIGMPRDVAENMFVSENLSSLNWEKINACCDLSILEKREFFVRRKGRLVRLNFWDKLQNGDAVYRPLHDGDIVLINRPPSIHPHSLLALRVKILPTNSVLSINPLICSPLRGDFDGDSLHGYVPQSLESRVELHEIVALKKQLVNKQNGKNLLSWSHDSLTAAHLLLEDGVILDNFQMQQLQMFCSNCVACPAFVKANAPNGRIKRRALNSSFWTGKQLFSFLLPQDFDYDSSGIYISKGDLLASSSAPSWLRDNDDNIFIHLIKHCQEEKVLEFLTNSQEAFLEWLSMRGLSVSLSDLYLCSDMHSRKNLTDEIYYALREAERISQMKLLMVESYESFLGEDLQESSNSEDFGIDRMFYEQQKSAALSCASLSSLKQIFWDIQNLIYCYLSKSNSFLTMLKAGSKGNLMKFLQHSMCLGYQHSIVPLSFFFPHKLTCVAWNNHKKTSDTSFLEKYIPCGIIENSFLTGLNPLEFFVHSVTNRDGSFGGHADISGTLMRKIMFFMRDLYVGYDGTVRNTYGHHLVQFRYNAEDKSYPSDQSGSPLGNSVLSGEPVGVLAACAISEAAYGALDQPVSALENSPLLNLKKVLECGVKKASGDKTASLFLSDKLKRWTNGLEYGTLEVKNFLEKLIFRDIVSHVKIFFSPQTSHLNSSPWVCHFYINKEVMKKKQLKVRTIINALDTTYSSAMIKKSKLYFPILMIKCKYGSEDCTERDDEKLCITVRVVESSKNSGVQLSALEDMVVPFLLATVVKGSSNVKKVEILWRDQQNVSKTRKSSSGELYLRVFMADKCDRNKFWRHLVDDCIQIMDMIDWDRSHPDNIQDVTLAQGIDAAWSLFLSSLKNAVYDTGRSILKEHLILAADFLSSSGEFVALSPKGLSQLRTQTSVSSPFMLACFSNPADGFVKAAKAGAVDNLQGSIDALAWGNLPSFGTGGQFEILISGKGHEIAKSEDIYSLLLEGNVKCNELKVEEKTANEQNNVPAKSVIPPPCKFRDFDEKGWETFKAMLRKSVQLQRRFLRLPHDLKHILHKYADDHTLSEEDTQTARMALFFHPRRNEKIGCGVKEIKVGSHSKHENSRCFLLVRMDGTVEDFSYHKCVYHALHLIAPKRAKTYSSRWLNGKTNTEV